MGAQGADQDNSALSMIRRIIVATALMVGIAFVLYYTLQLFPPIVTPLGDLMSLVPLWVGTAVGGAIAVRRLNARWPEPVVASLMFDLVLALLIGWYALRTTCLLPGLFYYIGAADRFFAYVAAGSAGVFLLPLLDPEVRKQGPSPSLVELAKFAVIVPPLPFVVGLIAVLIIVGIYGQPDNFPLFLQPLFNTLVVFKPDLLTVWIDTIVALLFVGAGVVLTLAKAPLRLRGARAGGFGILLWVAVFAWWLAIATVPQVVVNLFTITAEQRAARTNAAKDPLNCALLATKSLNNYVDAPNLFIQIAIGYAEAGKKDKALETLAERLKLPVPRVDDPGGRADALTKIANVYTKVGQKDKASELLLGAFRLTKMIKFDFNKPQLLINIAAGYETAGLRDKELEVLPVALQSARTTQDPVIKALSLAKIPGAYARAGRRDKAMEVLPEADRAARGIAGGMFIDLTLAQVLADIAIGYAETGQRDKAAERISSVVQRARSLRDATLRAQLLQIAGDGYIKIGRKDKALPLLCEARWSTRTLFGPTAVYFSEDIPLILADIAIDYAEAGRRDKASEVMSEALQSALLASKFSNPVIKSRLIPNLAIKCAKARIPIDRKKRQLARQLINELER